MSRKGEGGGGVSIVVPALDEARHLPGALASCGDAPLEVIVADGGSRDGTPDVARRLGARVVGARRGRGHQMNVGAAAARGDILLFLHADTRLPAGYAAWVAGAMGRPGVAAGAFRLAIDGAGAGLRFVERSTRWRSEGLQMPYGDQALFLRAETFRALGGFRELPLMEDFDLVRRLRRRGRVVTVPAAVRTSARRWRALGVFRTTLVNQLIVAGFLAGVPVDRLERWYRRRRGLGG